MGLINGKVKVLKSPAEYQWDVIKFAKDTVNSFRLIKTCMPEIRELIELKYPTRKNGRNYYIDYHRLKKKDHEKIYEVLDGVLPEEIVKELNRVDDIEDILTMHDDDDDY